MLDSNTISYQCNGLSTQRLCATLIIINTPITVWFSHQEWAQYSYLELPMFSYCNHNVPDSGLHVSKQSCIGFLAIEVLPKNCQIEIQKLTSAEWLQLRRFTFNRLLVALAVFDLMFVISTVPVHTFQGNP
jgi:hypothetical protein